MRMYCDFDIEIACGGLKQWTGWARRDVVTELVNAAEWMRMLVEDVARLGGIEVCVLEAL